MVPLPGELSPYIAKVESYLGTCMNNDFELFRDILKHMLLSNTKRLRPGLAMLGYLVVEGKDSDSIVEYAAAMELLHIAAIIHEDIVEGSPLRNGRLTTVGKFGCGNAMIARDFFITKALQIISKYGQAIVDEVIASIMTSAVGMAEENLKSHRINVEEEEYIETIKKKVSPLIAVSLTGAAMYAGASNAELSALKEFGINLGVVYQIKTELLDLVPSYFVYKPDAMSVRECRFTMPILIALKKVDESEKEYLRDVFAGKKELSEAEVLRIVTVLKRTCFFNQVINIMGKYSSKSMNALSVLPTNIWKIHLTTLLNIIRSRED